MATDLTEILRPRVSIPATRVTITRQYILDQALKALGAGACEITDLEWNVDEILCVVSMDIPPHGDTLVWEKERKFYGEPMKSKPEALESAYDAALQYLQESTIVVIDDANLQELKRCNRALQEANFWAGVFETRCTLQKAAMSVMSEQIELLTSHAPLSPPSDNDVVHEIIDEGLPVHGGDGGDIHDFALAATEPLLPLQVMTGVQATQNTTPPPNEHADGRFQLSTPSTSDSLSASTSGTSSKVVQRSLFH